MAQTAKEWLTFLREQYPVGSRVRLREMRDPYCPVEPGTMGTLTCIDDTGTFHVRWDNGRDLGLILGEDRFTVLPPPLRTLKLYMPMTAGYFDNEYDEEIVLGPQEAAEYAPQITAALEWEHRRLEGYRPEAAERGLMAYYHEADSIAEKVRSYYFTAEVREGRLWGVAVCGVRGELTGDELDRLREYVAGQASDGLGEVLEQREIPVGDGLEIYPHLWQHRDWSIRTEKEQFSQEMGGMTLG